MYLKTVEDSKPAIEPGVLLLLNDISRFLADAGVKAYLVGGFVRDRLLGRNTADIDIAVAGDALEIASKAATALGGTCVPLDKENGTGRVVLPHHEIDFTTLRGDIANDLAQRDFTIDAIAVELKDTTSLDFTEDTLIDPFNGREDLRRGLIRAVGDEVFTDDAARLIRAVRFAAELGFGIDDGTEALIRRQGQLIAGVAGERLREELLRILATPRAGRMLAYLGELGILTALVPELLEAKGVTQPHVHVWDVYEHSLQTVKAVEFILREGEWEHAADVLAPVPWSGDLESHFNRPVGHGSTHRSLLKLAALLHDIAKPQTRTLEADGRARFLGHPQQGAAAAAAVMARLRFSTRETRLVELMVNHHMRPTQLSHEGLPSRRAIYRYLRDTAEAAIDILFLSLADHLAARGNTLDRDEWRRHARIVEYVLEKSREDESLSLPPKLIDGHDIIKTFGLEPGPQVGGLLEALREAQAAGEIADRQAGLEYIRHLITEQRER